MRRRLSTRCWLAATTIGRLATSMRSSPPIHENPYIAYCGNLQGRHIKEPGAKGCLLVSVEEGELLQVEFVANDALRWQMVEMYCDRATPAAN